MFVGENNTSIIIMSVVAAYRLRTYGTLTGVSLNIMEALSTSTQHGKAVRYANTSTAALLNRCIQLPGESLL
jgi:hypothetical protein